MLLHDGEQGPRSRSWVGKPPFAYDHSGCSRSSSSRGLPSTAGAKNGRGSAVWMSTGSPSSPAAANTGAQRGSSGSSSSPPASRKPSPSVFHTLSPRAPAAAERRSSATSPAAKSSPRAAAPQSTWQNVANRAGWARS